MQLSIPVAPKFLLEHVAFTPGCKICRIFCKKAKAGSFSSEHRVFLRIVNDIMMAVHSSQEMKVVSSQKTKIVEIILKDITFSDYCTLKHRFTQIFEISLLRSLLTKERPTEDDTRKSDFRTLLSWNPESPSLLRTMKLASTSCLISIKTNNPEIYNLVKEQCDVIINLPGKCRNTYSILYVARSIALFQPTLTQHFRR